MIFFSLNNERKIGYKLLSSADLGAGSSHQTHIGLSEHVFTFMSDRDVINEEDIFIYDDGFDYIAAHFDRIKNPDGSYRSPKIRMGGRDAVSVTSTIREIAKREGMHHKWFLFWFGLESEKAVYLLFNDLSDDFNEIVNLGLDLSSVKGGAKVVEGRLITPIADFIEAKLNKNGLATLRELEVEAQIGITLPNRKFRIFDIERANKNARETGKLGEEKINDYLNKKLHKREIEHFCWYNEEQESGLPYDFTVQAHNGNITYIDVKTTMFDFGQKMIFSNQEVEFISSGCENYSIYRVYSRAIDSESFCLRICNSCKELATMLNSFTNEYKFNLSIAQTDLRNVKIAISPNHDKLQFEPEILLT